MCRGRQRTKPRIIPKRQTKQKRGRYPKYKTQARSRTQRGKNTKKKQNTGNTRGKNAGNAGTNAQ